MKLKQIMHRKYSVWWLIENMYSGLVLVIMITGSPVSCHFAQTYRKTHIHINTHRSIRSRRQAESTDLSTHAEMRNAEIQRRVGFPLSFGH